MSSTLNNWRLLATTTVVVGLGVVALKPELECNYVSIPKPYYENMNAVGICTTNAIDGLVYSEQFDCNTTSEPPSIIFRQWINVTDCSGTPEAIYSKYELLDYFDVMEYSYRCGGRKNSNQCAYSLLSVYSPDSENCGNGATDYHQYAILNNVCNYQSERPSTAATCYNDNNFTIYTYSEDSDCVETPISSITYNTNCTGDPKYKLVCVTDVDPTTTAPEKPTDVCKYVEIEGLLSATDKCMKRVLDTTYSQMFICNGNDEPELHIWPDSDACEGDTNVVLTMYEFATTYNLDSDELDWNCLGTKSNDECDIANILIYVPSSSCDEVMYREYFMLNGVCEYIASDDLWMKSSCSNSEVLIKYYSQASCSQSLFSRALSNGCEQDGDSYEKLSITCSGETSASSRHFLVSSQIWAVVIFFTFFVLSS